MARPRKFGIEVEVDIWNKRFLQNMAVSDIAKQYNVSVQTVHNILKRQVVKIQDDIQEEIEKDAI